MICNILGQCFQLVYREATMQCFDQSHKDTTPSIDIFSRSWLFVYSLNLKFIWDSLTSVDSQSLSSASRTNDVAEGPSL